MAAETETMAADRADGRQNILVVDDDDLFRESLHQNLIDAGFDALTFADGASVLDFISEGNKADLILLDWRMPGMTGIEVLRRLRDGGGDIPVIFLTALSDQMYEEAALIGGAVDFVGKRRQKDNWDVASDGRQNILVVDDDDLFRESLHQNLIDAGFDALTFADGASVLDFISEGNKADLILLDWRMPGMTGIEVLRRLRDGGGDIPVIFLTALSDQMYEEAALIGGAVDFVEKSRSFTILKRRIDLIMDGPKGRIDQEAVTPAEDPETMGRMTLKPAIGRAYWNDAEVNLTLTEFKIVNYLAQRTGRDVRYREIYDLVRGEGFVAGIGEDGYRANVRAFIKRIRQKFRDRSGGGDAC